MKKTKNNLAKKCLWLTVPFLNILLIICITLAFSWQNSACVTEEEKNTKNAKNEKIISVYFHKTGEIRKLELEEYLVGVLPAEMPPSFELEALKAQAVAARTYILSRENSVSDTHKDAVVCTDSTHCKAYMTEDEADKKWGIEWDKTYKNKIKRAIYETKGEIVTYNDEPISAVFHSTSGGKTENSEDVWQNALPYLRSVKSEGEEASPRFTSQVTVSYNDFKDKIKKLNDNAFFSENTSEWIGKSEYNVSGSVKTIVIGGVSFKGTEIRSAFGLRSANFKITVSDNIVFDVTGNGHGVGMSQYGANYAAQNGYTYDKILKKYYQGVEIDKYKF